MRTLGFVIRHGWSFQATSLQRLATRLQRLTPHVLLDDLGYWSHAQTLHPRGANINWIAIGHSFGFMSLMLERQTPWHAAIGIGAFNAFPSDALAAMEDSFRRQPIGTLRAFRRRCDRPRTEAIPPFHEAGYLRMTADLLQLRHACTPELQCPVLYLHGARDRVVPPIQQSIVHASRGHDLGIEESDWCAERIASFIHA